jgi:hypothetical protein
MIEPRLGVFLVEHLPEDASRRPYTEREESGSFIWRWRNWPSPDDADEVVDLASYGGEFTHNGFEVVN